MSNLIAIGILISGRGSNMESIINACKKNELEAIVNVVISDNPKAKGVAIAKKFGITTFILEPKTYTSKQEYEDDIIRILKGHAIDLVCLAGYMRVVGKGFLDAYKGRLINIHPSLLPSFKGLNAQQQALDYVVKYTGCTVHYVNDILDGGAIIKQEVVPILDGDTVKRLSQRILEKEHHIYIESIKYIIKSRSLKREEVR